MKTTAPSRTKRNAAIDILRFAAILLVFFGHYTDNFNYVYQIVPENLKYTIFSKYASTALLIFFMVSGFVVTMTSIKRGIKDFIIVRLTRLYPLFWVSCVAAFLLTRLPIGKHSYLAFLTFKDFLVNLTMIPTALGYPMLNPVFHTLLIELVFYFFLAVIIIFNWWKNILVFFSIMLTLCIASLFKPDMPLHIVVAPFLAGMMFYFISINHPSKIKLYILLSITFICSLMSAFPLVLQLDILDKAVGRHSAWVVIIIITCTYIFFFLIATKRLHINTTPFLQIIGQIAYSFNLFHIYFLFIYFHFRSRIQGDILLFGILGAVLLTSYAMNKYIERPLSNLANDTLYWLTSLFDKKSFKKQSLEP